MPESTPDNLKSNEPRPNETSASHRSLANRWPWATFLIPMLVYMVLGSFEPTPPEKTPTPDPSTTEATQPYFPPEPSGFLPEIPYEYYPWAYSAKITLTIIAMLAVGSGYLAFPWKVSWLSIVVGVVGVVLWIAICHLQLEVKVLEPVDRFLGNLLLTFEEDETPGIGLMSLIGAGERPAFNPLEHLKDTPVWAYVFLAIRFTGLALIVPVIEEFFLRGFLMRYVMEPQWWKVPIGEVNRTAVNLGTAVPMLMHPGELLAAFVWFSMVTWLMVRTRNIWDCVVAHAVTNLLLGIYVVTTGNWQLM